MVTTILIGHSQTGNGGIFKKRQEEARQKKKAGGGGGGGAEDANPSKAPVTRADAAQEFKRIIEDEFPDIRVSVWQKNGLVRAYVKDTTQRRSGAQDRGYLSFTSDGVDNGRYRGFLSGGETVNKFISTAKIKPD